MTAFATYPSLVDRHVFVSGGATGIGAAFVEHFAQQGARVSFVDIDRASAEQLVKSLAAAKHRPLFLPCDVTDLAALGDDGLAKAYMETVLTLPAFREWEEGAKREMAARG